MSETDPYWDTRPSHGANDACYIFEQGLSITGYFNIAAVNAIFTANKATSSFTVFSRLEAALPTPRPGTPRLSSMAAITLVPETWTHQAYLCGSL